MDSRTTAAPRGPANAAFIRLLYGILGTWLIIGAPLLLYMLVAMPGQGGLIPVAVMVLGAYLLAAVLWIRKGIRVTEK